jgi:hypothetical protein
LSKEGLFCVGFRWNKKRSFSFLIPPERKEKKGNFIYFFPPLLLLFIKPFLKILILPRVNPIFARLASIFFPFKVCGPFYYLVTCAFVTKKKVCS